MPTSSAIYDDGRALPLRASSNVIGARLVKATGPKVNSGNIPAAHCGATDEPLALAARDMPSGKVFTGERGSVVAYVTASGAITAGKGIETAADGKVAQLSTGKSRGVAIETSIADGDLILAALNI